MSAFNLGDILVNIKANTTSLKSGLNDVQNMGTQTKSLGQKIQTGLNVAAAGLAVVGTGLTVYAKKATDYTTDLVKSAKGLGVQLGISTTEASRLSAATQRLGIDSGSAAQMFGIFEKQIVAATSSSVTNTLATQKLQIEINKTKDSIKTTTAEIAKNGDASGQLKLKIQELNNTLATQENSLKSSANAFQQLGVSTVDANGNQKDFETILFNVADKFQTMPSGIDKTTLAMQLFGRSGKDMLKFLDLGSSGIKELEKKADALGLTLNAKTIGAISNLVAAQKDLNAQTSSLKIAVGTATAPILTAFDKALNNVIGTLFNANPHVRAITANFLAFGGPVASGASAVLAFGANLDQALPALKTMLLVLTPWIAVLALVVIGVLGIVKQMGGWHVVLQKLQPEIAAVKHVINDLHDGAIAAFKEVAAHISDVFNAMKLIATGNFQGGIFGLKADSPAIAAMKHIHDALSDVWNILVSVGSFVASNFMPVLNELITVFMALWPSIKAVFASLWENLLPALQSIWDAVTKLWNALNPFLIDTLEVLGALIGIAIVGAIYLFINGINIAIDVLSVIIHIIADVIGWIANLAGWIGTAAVAVARAIGDMINWFSNLPHEAGHAVDDVVGWFTGLPKRLGHAMESLGSFLSPVWDAMKNGFKGSLDWVIDQANKLIRGYNDTVGKIPGTPHIGNIAKFAKGVANFAGGGALVGEEGPELGLFPKGTTIVPHNLTANLVDNLSSVSGMLKSFMSNGPGALLSGNQLSPAAAAVSSQKLTQNTNFYGDINIGSRADADYFLQKLDRNNKLENMGLSPS